MKAIQTHKKMNIYNLILKHITFFIMIKSTETKYIDLNNAYTKIADLDARIEDMKAKIAVMTIKITNMENNHKVKLNLLNRASIPDTNEA